MLSDRDILKAVKKGSIRIDPWDDNLLQAASYDLRFGREAIVYTSLEDWKGLELRVDEEGWWCIEPGEFMLACTLEVVRLGDNVVGRLDGKSSWGRRGLMVHCTAGMVAPGWSGKLTLELSNMGYEAIELKSGMPICQISFEKLSSRTTRPYQGRYYGAETVQPSKLYVGERVAEHHRSGSPG